MAEVHQGSQHGVGQENGGGGGGGVRMKVECETAKTGTEVSNKARKRP